MISMFSTLYVLLNTILICRYYSNSTMNTNTTATLVQQQSKNNNGIGLYALITYSIYTLLFYFGCILAGASISFHTLYACIFMSHILTLFHTLHLITQLKPNHQQSIVATADMDSSNGIMKILYHSISIQSHNIIAMISCICIGLIVAAILFILDTGLQIQRYPMPIIIGSFIGYVVGTCFDLCYKILI